MADYPFSIIVTYPRVLNQGQEKEQKFYFSLKRKSGGGECRIIKLSSTQYRVSYKTTEVMDRVLNHPNRRVDSGGEVLEFTLEAEAEENLTTESSASAEEHSAPREEQTDEGDNTIASIPEQPEYSETTPMEQDTFVLVDNNIQYEVVKEKIEKEILPNFPSLQLILDSLKLKLKGHCDLKQARQLIKDVIRSVSKRKVYVVPAIAYFLQSQESIEISKKIFGTSDVILDSKTLYLYALSNALLDQAETALQTCLKEESIKISANESVIISSEDGKDLMEKSKSHDILISFKENGDTQGGILYFVGFTKTVEKTLKSFNDYFSQKISVKEKVDLQHRIIVEKLTDLLTTFTIGQLPLSVNVSKHSGQIVTLTGPREEVNKAKAILQAANMKLHVNSLCIKKHGSEAFFNSRQGQQLIDKLQKEFKCLIFISNSENREHRSESVSSDHIASGSSTGGDSQKKELPSKPQGAQQAQQKDSGKKVPKEDKPPLVQLILSEGKLENKTADMLVAPLLSQKPVLEELTVTKALKQKGEPRFGNLFSAACPKPLVSGAIFEIPTPGDNYGLSCNYVIFIACLPWDRPNGAASVALRTGIKNMLTKCNSRNQRSISMSALACGKKLGFPGEMSAKIVGEEIKSFVESTPNHSLRKIEIVIPQENQNYNALYFTYRATLLQMDLGNRIIFCNESGVAFRNISFGERQHVKLGNTSVIVTYNDITKEKTDAIVNLTNFSHWNEESEAHAIFRAAGPSILEEAKRGSSAPGLVMTGPGNLQCKWIIHCNCSNNLDNISRLVKDILLHCENVGLQSVAIPAIGTGECGFKPDQVAHTCMETIRNYLIRTRRTNCLTCIRLVIFRLHIYEIFCEALKRCFRPVLKSSWNPMNLLTSRLRNRQFTECEAIRDLTLIHDHVTATPAILLMIVTDLLDNVDAIKLSLKEEFDKQYKEEKIEHECLKTLSLEELQTIFSAVNERPEVEMTLDRLNNCIFLKGCEIGVLQVVVKVHTSLTGIMTRRLQNVITEQAGLLVQWGYSDDDDSYPFTIESSLLLEEKYQAERMGVVTVTLEKSGKKVTVNVASMKATLEGTTVEGNAIRRDLENETNLPQHWDDMNGLIVMTVELDINSEEYNNVKINFNRTANNPIEKIERVQNKHLQIAYTLRKEYMTEKNGADNVNERSLFHGTAPQNCQSINTSGFNRSFVGQNAAAYGNGVYFAVDASYSAKPPYTSPDPQTGERFMYMAKVLVGHHTKGQAGMKVPPRRQLSDESDLYDSLTDNQNNPSMFVVFHDDQVYPEYLITFR
ncbi:protein mono-ADP-ribosyltransferase PARP14-like [Hyperolius riggenbachi]|uniref:protein mono-ADP-ribosyltransferase PARP14-like n=1 Tax=Hyperolius riggenbachi TaxID=752182 RepID=UPI0035A347B2